MTAIEIYTDALRWWGFLGGIIGLDDFRRRIIAWTSERRWMPVRTLWLDAAAKALVCTFLVLAGFALPLTSRVAGLTLRDSGILAVLAAAWTCIAMAGWSYVISRAMRPSILILCGCIALIACLFFSVLTARGA